MKPIDLDLYRRLPGPLNTSTVLMLVLICSIGPLLTAVGSMAGLMRGVDVGGAPAILPGGLCGTMSFVLFGLPLYFLFPPTDRAVVKDHQGLVWKRSNLPRARVLGLGLVVVGPAMLLTGLLMTNRAPLEGYVQQPPDPEVVHTVVRKSWRDFAIGGAAYGVALGVFLLLVKRYRRATPVLEINERGVVLDGTPLAYRDIVGAEVVGHRLQFHLYTGVLYQVPVTDAELGFAEAICRRVRSHMPDHTEDRSAALRQLEGLIH